MPGPRSATVTPAYNRILISFLPEDVEEELSQLNWLTRHYRYVNRSETVRRLIRDDYERQRGETVARRADYLDTP
jgi:Arc/MetJ-type ribon-helix-helix transcriptional regulator